MDTLARAGPGPWVLLFRIRVAAAAVLLPRRTACWGGRGVLRHPGDGRLTGGPSPVARLGRRFATGEIGEEECRRRLSVLDERFGADPAG